MVTLIIPIAGKSSRFKNTRPKPFLTNPNGKLMLCDCLDGLPLNEFSSIWFIILEEHLKKYCNNDIEYIKQLFNGYNVNVYILKRPTASQSETVYKLLKDTQFEFDEIFIKDVDNQFYMDKMPNVNSICCFRALKNDNSKSYITLTNDGYIDKIEEKNVISDTFCVSGYFFKYAIFFVSIYEFLELKSNNMEIYISNIIQTTMTMLKEKFIPMYITNYKDWGTYEKWIEYKNTYKTIFCDIDGTLFENTNKYNSVNLIKPIQKNIDVINKLKKEQNIQLILTTARQSLYKKVTEQLLELHNVKYDHLMMNLHHAKRYLINDFNDNTNPYPSAISINTERDCEFNQEILKILLQ